MQDKDKWNFSDYAYPITGIIVAVLLVGPEILDSLFGISLLGGSLADAFDADALEDAVFIGVWTLPQLRALSPMLFLLTTTAVFFKEAFDARSDGGYQGFLFNNTFETLLEDAIYMAITTVMVYSAVLFGVMYISWLAGPITWILFIFIFPIVKLKSDKAELPLFLLTIFILGIIAELLTGAWIAFPFSWLLICVVKFGKIIRDKIKSIDNFFNFLYYVSYIILIVVGLMFNVWIISWISFLVALLSCWVVKKLKFFT